MSERDQGTVTRTVLTDIDIPFGRLVVIFIKFGLAWIPAIIVVWAIMAAIVFLISLVIGVPMMTMMGQRV